MKKIAIVRFDVSFGGIEHQIINLVSQLYHDYLFVLITKESSDFAKEFEKYGKVYFIGTTHLFDARKKMIKIIEDENIDIIQSHMLREHYICCLCKYSIKNIYHIFRVHTYIDCSFISNLKKRLYHILSHILSNNVDLYLPINKINYDELIKRSKIKKEKIRIVHDGVKSINEAISNSDYFNYYDLVMVANLIYGKGHDIAIKALAELVKKNKKYNITFIGNKTVDNGDSEYSLNSLEKLAQELGVLNNVKFLGYVKDISPVLKDKSIVILPSYSEGTPNCLLEAMSAKKIVVASSVGGIPEFIQNEINGFLHKNKDYDELANIILKIKKMSKSKLKSLENSGYNIWLSEYCLEKVDEQFRKIYDRIV